MLDFAQTVDATFPGLDSVRSGAVSAYISESPTLRYYAGMKPCDIAVVGQSFGPSVYTLGLQVGLQVGFTIGFTGGFTGRFTGGFTGGVTGGFTGCVYKWVYWWGLKRFMGSTTSDKSSTCTRLRDRFGESTGVSSLRLRMMAQPFEVVFRFAV